ncbi:MAG: PEGA domain-containing protein [Bradymonadia bacterium]
MRDIKSIERWNTVLINEHWRNKEAMPYIKEFSEFLKKLKHKQPLLTVKTVPEGASVIIDGRRVGLSPWSDYTEPGAYNIELTLDGHLYTRRAFTHVAGSPKVLEFELVSNSTPAEVKMQGDLTGISVEIDGEEIASPHDEQVLKLKPGAHTLTFIGSEARSFVEMRLEAGEQRVVDVPGGLVGTAVVDDTPFDWATTGLIGGGALTATGLAFVTLAILDDQQVQSWTDAYNDDRLAGRTPGRTPGEIDDLYSQRDGRLLLGGVVGVAGLAILGASLWLDEGGEPEPVAPAQAGVEASPSGLVWRW